MPQSVCFFVCLFLTKKFSMDQTSEIALRELTVSSEYFFPPPNNLSNSKSPPIYRSLHSLNQGLCCMNMNCLFLQS